MFSLLSLKKAVCVLGVTLFYLIAADLIGVAVSLVLDIAPLRGKSDTLFYSIWFVLGVFCGLLSFDRAGRLISGAGEGDWSARPDSGRIGWLVIFASASLYSLMCALGQLFLWRFSVAPSYFVPDNKVLTTLFSVSVVGSMVVANAAFRPARQR